MKVVSVLFHVSYVRRNKTDRTDVKGLLEAYRDSDIHPVPIKTLAQQQLTALHRIRSTWMRTRTARINTVRGLLREFGYVIPTGADTQCHQISLTYFVGRSQTRSTPRRLAV